MMAEDSMKGEISGQWFLGQVTTLDIAENLLILTFEAHEEVVSV